MSFKTLQLEIDAGIAIITFNRPDKVNAMNPQLHEDMTSVLELLRYDDAARVIVITGAGRSFCAGMDLKEVFYELKDRPNDYDRIIRIATEWRGRTLRYYPKPTIAMVNGYCFGGAFSILEGCDLATAADEASFGLSEINFKGFPGGSVSKSLANLLQPRDALLYAMTGRRFGGQIAARIGLVNFSVPLARLRDETLALAGEIALKDPHALRTTKEAYRYALQMSWDASVSYTSAKEAELQFAQEASWKEAGVGDFLAGHFKPGLEGHHTVDTNKAKKAKKAKKKLRDVARV
ncbi:MAG TPA: p-hydroxycinnamoyl CoA hydratase/lyase [Pseudolabrys sp.]|jgi:trans-feruloyl-CoA hydratase/vanillin synthase